MFWSLMAEPRVPNPPKRVWRDWVILAVLVPSVILEVLFRDDLVWRPVALVLGLISVSTLMWRRTNPLGAATVGLVTHVAGDVAYLFGNESSAALISSAWVILLPYSLFRWGSGRDAVIGSLIVFASHAHVLTSWTIVLGAIAFLLFPAALGADIRYFKNSRKRELERVKYEEREQLARELHDTVAHHVSAIAIQAQAGQAVAGSDPGAAVNALEVIEEAASRTLSEMRTMVGALRNGDEAELAPQQGVSDIVKLADNVGTGPMIDVDLSGDLDDLRPSVSSAIYRIAQESITNALRHARDPSRIAVRVRGEPEDVRLTVQDDGAANSFGPGAPQGYGLEGMTERAALLGGSLSAGPNPNGGWTVAAAVPRNNSAN